MGNVQFVAARYLAGMTKRPNLTFGVLMAMLNMEGPMYCERIACLLGATPIAISTVGKELEDIGFLARTWTPSAANVGPMGDHGRKRLYTLAPNWLTMIQERLTPLEWNAALAGICGNQARARDRRPAAA